MLVPVQLLNVIDIHSCPVLFRPATRQPRGNQKLLCCSQFQASHLTFSLAKDSPSDFCQFQLPLAGESFPRAAVAHKRLPLPFLAGTPRNDPNFHPNTLRELCPWRGQGTPSRSPQASALTLVQPFAPLRPCAFRSRVGDPPPALRPLPLPPQSHRRWPRELFSKTKNNPDHHQRQRRKYKCKLFKINHLFHVKH